MVERPAVVAEATQVELSGEAVRADAIAVGEPATGVKAARRAVNAAVAGSDSDSDSVTEAVAVADPVAVTGSGSVAAADPVAVAVAGSGAVAEPMAGSGSVAGSDSATGSVAGSGSARRTEPGSGSGSASSAPRLDRDALLRAILGRVRAARRYPELARRRELEGTVRVAFSVGPDGRPRDLSVTRPADPVLDSAAREAVEHAAPLPLVDGKVEIDLQFQLTDD